MVPVRKNRWAGKGFFDRHSDGLCTEAILHHEQISGDGFYTPAGTVILEEDE